MTTQHEKTFNFFEKTDNIVKKVNRQSYKKLIVLAITSVVTLCLIMGITSGIKSLFKASSNQNQIHTEFYANEIRQIDKNHFQSFMKYMAASQNIYDSRIELTSKALAQAEQKDYNHTLETSDAVKNLNANVTDFKHNLQKEMTTFSVTYEYVNSSNKDFDEKKLIDFLQYYHLYQAGVLMTDKDLEYDLNGDLYSSKSGNQTYNLDNHIFEQINVLTQNEKDRITQISNH